MIRWTILSIALYSTNVISLPIMIVLLGITFCRGIYNVKTKTAQEVFIEKLAAEFAKKWMK